MSERAVRDRFAGIHAVLYALFDSRERLDRELMRAQVEAVIAAGVHGVVVLGLATEVGKLSAEERKQLMSWVSVDLAGRVPYGVTINGNSVSEQLDQLQAAEQAGADWLILQPPTVGNYSVTEYLRFFGRVSDQANVPVALQNAPAYFGRGLSATEIRTLFAEHGNFQLIKGEGPATEIAELIATMGSDVPVLNGRGGLELTDNLRARCSGFVLAPDLVDRAVRILATFRSGDIDRADALYAEQLPAIVFVMQSLETLVVYGKRLFALRAGLGPVYDRAPCIHPTAFGLETTERLAQELGNLAHPSTHAPVQG